MDWSGGARRKVFTPGQGFVVRADPHTEWADYAPPTDPSQCTMQCDVSTGETCVLLSGGQSCGKACDPNDTSASCDGGLTCKADDTGTMYCG
jgi:hypothetical protein